jgi:hypothetical protein
MTLARRAVAGRGRLQIRSAPGQGSSIAAQLPSVPGALQKL